MGFSFGTVVEVRPTESAWIRRIVLEIDDPANLEVRPEPDSALGMYFPGADGTPAPAMTLRDGVWSFPDDIPLPEGRNYTVRYQDGNLLTVDFVVHERGVATSWAQRAQLGDKLCLSYERSWHAKPDDAKWQILVTDLAGLPAAARIIEESDTPKIVVAEVISDDDLDYLPTRDGVQVIASRAGNGRRGSQLADMVRALSRPVGNGYLWCACEAAASREIRKFVRREWGWESARSTIVGYWRFDSEVWDTRFAEVSDEMLAVYSSALDEGKSEEQAREALDAALERVGL